MPGTGERPSQLPGAGDRRDQIGQNRDERQQQFQQNKQQRQEQRQTRGDDIRNEFQDNHPRWDFWKDNPNWARFRYNRPYRWATWAALGGWVGYGGSDGGYGYDYSDDGVYVDGQEYPVDEQYTEQAATLAQAGTAPQPDNTEWMPLGVFALVQEEKGQPTMYLQLAISKQGIVSGTYFNSTTNQTLAVSGSLDRQTQRVALSTEKKTPVLETGIENLTQDQAPALLYFKDGQTQRWLLVRLPEPKEATQGQAAGQGG